MNDLVVLPIAETRIRESNMYEFLKALGAPKWDTDATDDSSYLIEVAGRLCYKAFGTDLNKNLTKVREGNEEYVKNIIKQQHGSVFEHASVTFGFLNVSRIFTHELVRHRAGTAFSQESQRFVRLDDFQVYIPDLDQPLRDLYDIVDGTDSPDEKEEFIKNKQQEFFEAFHDVNNHVKETLQSLIASWELDRSDVPFAIKKQLTSAMRRLVPGGVNTNIIVTANHRTWRHIINMRCSPGAEIEIFKVMNKVAEHLKNLYPAIYSDMEKKIDIETSISRYVIENPKI